MSIIHSITSLREFDELMASPGLVFPFTLQLQYVSKPFHMGDFSDFVFSKEKSKTYIEDSQGGRYGPAYDSLQILREHAKLYGTIDGRISIEMDNNDHLYVVHMVSIKSVRVHLYIEHRRKREAEQAEREADNKIVRLLQKTSLIGSDER